MFIDVEVFRRKLGLLMQYYNLLTDEERDILNRALEAYEEVERVLQRYDEITERRLIRKD